MPVIILLLILLLGASQVALVVKNLPANAGDMRDAGLIPGLRRSLGWEYSLEHGNPLSQRVGLE